jgi:hypothetical protein
VPRAREHVRTGTNARDEGRTLHSSLFPGQALAGDPVTIRVEPMGILLGSPFTEEEPLGLRLRRDVVAVAIHESAALLCAPVLARLLLLLGRFVSACLRAGISRDRRRQPEGHKQGQDERGTAREAVCEVCHRSLHVVVRTDARGIRVVLVRALG